MTHAESVYLDANATTIAHPEVIESMVSCMNEHGNPSSLHRAGQFARAGWSWPGVKRRLWLGFDLQKLCSPAAGPNQTTLRSRERSMPFPIGASVGGRSGACCRS